jgi:error-prone DNA polymerase
LWLAQRFPGRCWLTVELHRGADDASRLAHLLDLAACSGMLAVAAAIFH